MADLSRLVINEAEIQAISGPTGVFGQHVRGLAQRVENEAIQNASGRPGPRIRSGDLVEEVETVPGVDEDGFFYDIGSNAEHRNYPYPSRLETGADGHFYPWLRPALEEVFGNS